MDMEQIWTGLRLTQSTKKSGLTHKKKKKKKKKKKTEAPKTNKINS